MTIDEIWMLNVLGGTLVNKPYTLPNGTKRYELGYHRYFTELARILKPNGNLFIGEFLPRLRKVEWLMNANDYDSYGLSKQVYEGKILETFTTQHEISLRAISGWDRRYPPFFIALTKTAQTPTL